MRVAQLIIFGIATGGFLLLGTLGFALVRRVEGFLNIAHAELMSVAAFGTWYLNNSQGWSFFAAAGIAVVFTAALGWLIARVFYVPLAKAGPAVLLITSVGVVFAMQGVIEALVGVGIFSLDIPVASPIVVGGLRITTYQLAIVMLSLLATAALALFLNRTRTGKVIRAKAADDDLAEVRGLDVGAATRATWLASSALAGLAGVALAVLGTLTTDLAFGQILLILTVAIVAGLGSLYAVVAAAFLVGIAMDLSVLWLPGGFRPLIAFTLVILMLVFRPSGIAGSATS